MFCPCCMCGKHSADVGLFLHYVRLAQIGWVAGKTATGREVYVCSECAKERNLKPAALAGVPADIVAIAAGEAEEAAGPRPASRVGG